MKLSNTFQDLSQRDLTPRGWKGSDNVDNIVKEQAASHVQHVQPQAVQATVRQQDSRFQKIHDMVEGPAVGRDRGLKTQQQPPERMTTQKAQATLENHADQLAMRASQFQQFLTGGSPQGLTNWSSASGRTSNFASRIFGAGIPFMIRG